MFKPIPLLRCSTFTHKKNFKEDLIKVISDATDKEKKKTTKNEKKHCRLQLDSSAQLLRS